MNYLDEHYNEIFKKYTTEELLKDIDSYRNGTGNLNKVLNHFFEECIWNCCGKKTTESPMEWLNDDSKMKLVLEYIASKPKFFTSDEISNVKSYFRNSSSKVRKVANFPCKEARNIYFRYNNINESRLNILDTSMGFGSRMSAVLLSGHNYCGFDPNVKLYNKLTEYKNFLYNNNVISKEQKCCLRCSGSEIYFDNMKNAFDISFTSPPYFNLEKYADDKSESTKNYNNYDLWVKNFVIPTVQNTYKYLKIGGYAMINIKNINKKETCFDDFFNAFKNISGFEYVETFDMKIKKKNYGMAEGKGDIKNSEPIMCFRKVK